MENAPELSDAAQHEVNGIGQKILTAIETAAKEHPGLQLVVSFCAPLQTEPGRFGCLTLTSHVPVHTPLLAEHVEKLERELGRGGNA